MRDGRAVRRRCRGAADAAVRRPRRQVRRQLGANGFAGDGGSAEYAQFANPLGLAVDAGGNLLIADASNSRIRRIDTTSSHVIRTVAGNGSVGFAAENAPATSSPLPLSVRDVAAGPHGDIYIASVFEDGGNAPVYRIDAAGRIHRFAGAASITGGYGGDGGPATAAQIDFPAGVATDAAGNVYIAEGFRIRKVNPAGIITTYAGGASEGFSGDGGPATRRSSSGRARLPPTRTATCTSRPATGFARSHRAGSSPPSPAPAQPASPATAAGPSPPGSNFPIAVAADGAGNVYIADTGNHARAGRRPRPAAISTVAGVTQAETRSICTARSRRPAESRPGSRSTHRGNLFISDGAARSSASCIRRCHPPRPARCTRAAAQQLVERQHLGGFTGFTPQPVAKVLCGPFLGRHSRAMIVSLSRETCLPAGGFVVYRHVASGWHRVKTSLTLFGMVFRHGRTGFTEVHPLPGPNGVICTTHRWVGRNWHWNGRRLVHGHYHRVKAPTHV